jgi:hypothetical protein
MYTALTACASLGAILTMFALCVAGGTDERSTQFFVCWTGTPYLGYCGLAFARRRRSGASRLVFVGSALSAGLAVLLYTADLLPYIEARSKGEVVMNCAGPLIELGFPVVQWVFVGLLWLVTLPRWSRPAPA